MCKLHILWTGLCWFYLGGSISVFENQRTKADASGFVMCFPHYACQQPGPNAKVWNGSSAIMIRDQMERTTLLQDFQDCCFALRVEYHMAAKPCAHHASTPLQLSDQHLKRSFCLLVCLLSFRYVLEDVKPKSPISGTC